MRRLSRWKHLFSPNPPKRDRDTDMIFRHLWFLVLLVVIPLHILWSRRFSRPATVRFSTFQELGRLSPSFRVRLRRWILWILPYAAVSCLILALARPQSVSQEREYQTEGIDIVVAFDISGSMAAMDFQPENRLAVAKEEAKRFVRGRKNDRIGLVIFARESYTQCPLTLDYDVLTQLLEEVEMGLIKDGTAIGLALATSVNRLRDSPGKSKVILLITDGANNAGNIDPITAAEIAKSFGIRIHSICVGRGGLVPFPVDDPLFGRRYVQAEVEIDELLLQQVSAVTGGLYFRARDEKSLRQIYETIDRLEKSKVKVKEYSTYEELFPYFLIPGIFVLLMAVGLENTLLLKIP